MLLTLMTFLLTLAVFVWVHMQGDTIVRLYSKGYFGPDLELQSVMPWLMPDLLDVVCQCLRKQINNSVKFRKIVRTVSLWFTKAQNKENPHICTFEKLETANICWSVTDSISHTSKYFLIIQCINCIKLNLSNNFLIRKNNPKILCCCVFCLEEILC